MNSLGSLASLGKGFRALVFGASGTLGRAFVEALQSDANCEDVIAVSRQTHALFSLTDESGLAELMASFSPTGSFQLIIDATGALTIDGKGPEKHLGALEGSHLMKAFQINAVGPALLFKHALPLLDTQRRSVYAKLSARVGSIGDNRKGGWYGYRASKAALNMLLHTAAIEAARKRPHLVVAAMQPGTVASNLSQPFVAAAECVPAQTSVQGLLQTLDTLPAKSGAHFVDYKGQTIVW